MAKKPAKPEPADKTTDSGAATIEVDLATTQTSESTAIDLSAPVVQNAIAQGKAHIAEGKSKADAARAIFAVLKDEEKEVIVAAFIEGATLTPKGALTYWYNCRRKASKARKQD